MERLAPALAGTVSSNTAQSAASLLARRDPTVASPQTPLLNSM